MKNANERMPASRMFWIASRSRLLTVFLALLALMLTSSACGRADARLRDEVRSRLTADPTTASLRLDISVTNGVVHMGGETRTRAEQEREVQVVRGTQGIKGVISDLKISDREIVDNVKTAFAADPLVAQVPVTVEAKDGEALRIGRHCQIATTDRKIDLAGPE